MESKVDILGYNSTYQWDRYETGPARIFQWQRYNYDIEYHHYYNNYPTIELDKDYTCYGIYEKSKSESCFANFEQAKWSKFGARRFWHWSIDNNGNATGPYKVDDYEINWIQNDYSSVMYELLPDMMIRGIDWIDEDEITDPSKLYVERPFAYQFKDSVIYDYSKFVFTPRGDIPIWYLYNGNKYDGFNYLSVPASLINWDDWDLTTLYAGVYHNGSKDVVRNKIENTVGVWWSGWNYESAMGITGLQNYFIKHKTKNEYIDASILPHGSQINFFPNLIHCGKAPNTDIVEFMDMFMYKVSLYSYKEARVITDNDTITTGRYNSSLLASVMSKNTAGFSTQPDYTYTQIGPVRGDAIDGTVFRYTDQQIDLSNKNRYVSYGIISAGTLVPFKWHITFKRMKDPLHYYPTEEFYEWNGQYLCWDLQVEKVPRLNVLWGIEDDGQTYWNTRHKDTVWNPIKERYEEIEYYIENYYTDYVDELDFLQPLDLKDNRGLSGYTVKGLEFINAPKSEYAEWYFKSQYGDDTFHLNIPFGRFSELDIKTIPQTQGWVNYDGYAIKTHSSDGSVILKEKVGLVNSYDRNKYPDNGISGGYYTTFYGSVIIQHSKKGLPTSVYSTVKDAFPLNGLKVQGNKVYWYIFRDRTYSIIRTYDKDKLIGNVELTQSAGSSDAFSVGTVAGASISFDAFRPIAEILPYYNFDAIITYDFNGETVREGIFTIKEITENGLNKTHVVGYDATHKLDIQFKPLADKLSYPITAQRLFNTVCAYCGIPYEVELDFLNDDAEIEAAFGDENTTCREVMEWIAQIAGGIIVVNDEGFLEIKRMAQEEYSRGSNNWNTYQLDVSMLPIQKPTAIQYKDGEEIKLVLAENPSAISIIDYSDNPFTFYSNKNRVNYWLKNTITSINALGDIYAFEVKISHDWYNIQCGDSWVVASNSVTPRRGVIQNKVINNSGVIYTSSGEIVSLSSDKALSDNEISNIVEDIERMYSIIQVNGFVVKDSLIGEDILVIDEGYIFTPENTTYLHPDLSFDITAQFDSLYLGLPVEILLDNGDICDCEIIDGIMTFTSSTEIPLRYRDIQLEIRNEVDELEAHWNTNQYTSLVNNIETTGGSKYLIIVNDGVAAAVPPLTNMIETLSYLCDGIEVEFISTNNGFYNEQLDLLVGVETTAGISNAYWKAFTISYNNHIFTLKYIRKSLDQSITINNIEFDDYNIKVYTIENIDTEEEVKTLITFPYTIPAGTYYYQFPTFIVEYDDYPDFNAKISYDSDNDYWVLKNRLNYENQQIDEAVLTIDANGIMSYAPDDFFPVVKYISAEGWGWADHDKSFNTFDAANFLNVIAYNYVPETGKYNRKWIETIKRPNFYGWESTGWMWYATPKSYLQLFTSNYGSYYWLECINGQFKATGSFAGSFDEERTLDCSYDATTGSISITIPENI